MLHIIEIPLGDGRVACWWRLATSWPEGRNVEGTSIIVSGKNASKGPWFPSGHTLVDGDPVLGLDISMRSTGISVVGPSYALLHSDVVGNERPLLLNPEIDCIVRATAAIRAIKLVIDEFRPRCIVIEGPAYNATQPIRIGSKTIPRKSNRVCQLWQLTGALKYEVLKHWSGIGYRPENAQIITPNELKMHITGDGRADKDSMIAAIHKRFGLLFMDDNACDAYCLCVCHLDGGPRHVKKVRKKSVRENSKKTQKGGVSRQ